MPRHHLVPQMYLRRFADERTRLVMLSRDDQSSSRLITVNNACNEAGYYTIPSEDLQPRSRAGHDPEQVEQVFSQMETEAAQHLDELLQGQTFPPPPEARFKLAMFVAMQMTRSWRFRADMEALANVAARQWLPTQVTPERVIAFLRRKGMPTRPQDVEAFITRLSDSPPQLRMGQARAVQESLRFALEVVMPDVYFRRWVMRVFERPILLTSDQPVALWSPGPVEGPEPGVATAAVIWWPIDRQHLLSFSASPVDEVVREAPLSRARQVNRVVAAHAHRWIFHHPDDEGLAETELPGRSVPVEELVDVAVSDDEVRELWRVVRRPQLPG